LQRLQSYTKKMTYANLYAIFFGILLFGSVLDDFADNAFVAGDIDQIDAGGKGTHTEMGLSI